MKTVYKYPVYNIPGVNYLCLPVNSKILSFAQDPNGQACVWVLTNDGKPGYREAQLIVTGTGYPLAEESLSFIGTLQVSPYMWHCFEVTSQSSQPSSTPETGSSLAP
jgi:hypothetical protein